MTATPRSAGAIRPRLSARERAERAVKGDDLQQQIADLAVLLGWEWLHIGALRTKFGWRTPTRGTLSRWPDLTLVRERDRRLIFAEVKRELEEVRPEQLHVLEILRSLAGPTEASFHRRNEGGDHCGRCREPWPCPFSFDPLAVRVEVHVWRPSDLRDPITESVIGRILQ